MRSIPRGIDASGNYDWSPWKGHADFGMTSATRGTAITDAEFVGNWDSMSQLELVRFAMHWFSPVDDPASQAVHFYETAKAATLTEYDGLVVYIQPITGLDPVQGSFAAYVFCRELEELSGHTPVIFTTPHTAITGYCAKLGEYPLWVIDHDTPVPHVPLPWKEWALWEYASDILGLHVFNGKLRELDKVAAQ